MHPSKYAKKEEASSPEIIYQKGSLVTSLPAQNFNLVICFDIPNFLAMQNCWYVGDFFSEIRYM